MSSISQFKALFKKNFILLRRNKIGSLFELLFPIILTLLMVILKYSLKDDIYEERDYIGDCAFSQYYDENTKLDLSLLSSNAPSWMGLCKASPFASCVIYKRPLIGYIIEDNSLYMKIDAALLGSNGILNASPMPFASQKFANEKELEDYVRDENYESPHMPGICVGIVIKGSGNNYEVKLRYDDNYLVSEGSRTQQIPSPRQLIVDPIDNTPKDDSYQMYHTSGFMYLQSLIIRILGDGSINSLKVGSVPMRSMKYIESNFYNTAAYFTGVCVALSYLFSIFRITSVIVQDKETKVREGMKMMGLKDSAYWLSFIAYYVIIFLVLSLVLSLLVKLLVFANSNWFMIFLYYFLYGLSIFTYSFFMASFFCKAKIASIMTTMAYFALYFLASYIMGEALDLDISEGAKCGVSLLPTVAGIMGCNTFLMYERNEKAVNFSTTNNIVDNFNFTNGLLMLVANIFLYGILGLYFDNVIPTASGIRQPLLYFLHSDYWCNGTSKGTNSKQTAENEDLMLYPNGNFEKAGEELRAQEVSGECLKIRHLKKKFGVKTSVVDLSINMYRGQIFSLLGPNGAGKTTTISMLSGLLPPTSGEATFAQTDIFKEMAKLRQNLGVCPQHDVLFEMLTPKEHLEIFSAFKGRDAIEKKVTETLEDIDLNDSANVIVANLSGGQRRKLSIGIAFIGNSDIIFLDEPTSGIDLAARKGVWAMLKKYKQDKIIILTTHYMEEAEELGDRIGIMTHGNLRCLGSPLFLKTVYGAGYTLTLVHQEASQNGQEQLRSGIAEFLKSHVNDITLKKQSERELTYFLPKGQEVNLKELFADLDKRLNELRIQSYGMATNSLEDIFLKVANEYESKNDKSEEKDNIEEITDSSLDDYTITKEPEASFCKKFMNHFEAICVKRIYITLRNWGNFVIEILLPILIILMGFSLTRIRMFYDSDPRWFTTDLYNSPLSVVINSKDSFLTPTSGFTAYLDPHLKVIDYELTSLGAGDLSAMEAYLRDSGRYGSLFINKFDDVNKDYEYIIFADMKSQDSVGAFMSYFGQAMLRAAKHDSNYKLTFANAPLPITFESEGRERANKATLIAPTLIVSATLIAGNLVAFIVQERQDNLKHQQIITGLSLPAYWVGNSAIDIFKSLIPCCVSIGLLYAFGVQTPYDWLMILLYSIVIIPFTYALSFLFVKENIAQTFTMLLHFGIGMISSPLIYVLRMFDSTRQVGKILSWFLRIIPTFALSDAIFNINSRDLYAVLEETERVSYMNFDIAGGDVLMLCLMALISVLVMILVESDSFTCFSRSCKITNVKGKTTEKDGFVSKEEKYCDNLNLDTNPPAILAKHINKLYKLNTEEIKTAIEDSTFGLNKGECLALLGTSGAGKTTILKILTRDISSNAGQIYINGLSYYNNFAKIRKLIGYGPQYESSFMCLTVKENLDFYAKIKGIPVKLREQLVNKLIAEMDLSEYRNVQVGNLSGGNKRKTTVAIALLGNPPIVILDEPSTGVDPQSKRFMWQIIQRMTVKNKGVSVLFTTHSIEEAEYLCTKMAILIAGNFCSIGTPQELKEHFGKGYEIQISIPSPTKEEESRYLEGFKLSLESEMKYQDVVRFFEEAKKPELVAQLESKGTASHIMAELNVRKIVKAGLIANYLIIQERGYNVAQELANEFGEVRVPEHIGSFFKFRVDKSKEKHTIGFVFGLLQDIVAKYRITQYSASQASLNQIFQSMAKQAEYGLEVGQDVLVVKANGREQEATSTAKDCKVLTPKETVIEIDRNERDEKLS